MPAVAVTPAAVTLTVAAREDSPLRLTKILAVPPDSETVRVDAAMFISGTVSSSMMVTMDDDRLMLASSLLMVTVKVSSPSCTSSSMSPTVNVPEVSPAKTVKSPLSSV